MIMIGINQTYGAYILLAIALYSLYTHSVALYILAVIFCLMMAIIWAGIQQTTIVINCLKMYITDALVLGYSFMREDTVIDFKKLRELYADRIHEARTNWMEHVFSKSTIHDDGTAIIPEWAVREWKRQMLTPYCDLSEAEKDADRREADVFLEMLKQV